MVTMASGVQIRQAIFDWQSSPPSLTLNVMRTSTEGDKSADNVTVNGPAVQSLIDQVKTAILNAAQAKYGTRPVTMAVPSVEP